jgi:hypothetical protein
MLPEAATNWETRRSLPIFPLQKMIVTFKELSRQPSSVRILVAVEQILPSILQNLDAKSIKYVHLPPYHRLQSRDEVLAQCLSKQATHTIDFKLETAGEAVVMRLDGIDLTDFWYFRQAKQVCPCNLSELSDI